MSSGLYWIEVKRSAQRELSRLPGRAREAATAVVDGLAEHPRPHGSMALSGYPGLYRIRFASSYRVVYRVDDQTRVVTVLLIGHRKDVYRGL